MPSALTTFRESVQQALAAELSIAFYGGIIEGPVEDQTVGCAWVANIVQDDENALAANVELHVRVLLRQPQAPDTYALRDPARLEEAAGLLAAALRDVRASSPGVWFFTVLGIEIDLEQQGVEATLKAWADNPAA